MGFWKILGGAAACVGTIVALPIAGPVGAVSLAGAAIAGSTGALAGAIVSSVDDDDIENAERRGERNATAKYEKKFNKLVTALERAEARLSDIQGHYDLIIAMEALGMACAFSDGEIAPEERQEIDDFVLGLSQIKLPSHVQETIEDIATNPPSIKTAFSLASKIDMDSWDVFDEIIEITMNADGVVDEKEIVFRETWQRLKAAA